MEEHLKEMRANIEKFSCSYKISVEDIIQSLQKSQKNLKLLSGPQANEQILKRNKTEKWVKSMKILEKEVSLREELKVEKSLKESKIACEQGSLLLKNKELFENGLSEMNKFAHTILKNIVELMVTGKTFKIRQNFRGMVLDMLNLDEFSFYVCHDSGRVEFQDFASNFITEIMETDPKCQALENILASSSDSFHFVDLMDNSDFMKIFELSNSKIERNQYFGLSMKCGPGEDSESFQVCLIIKEKSPVQNEVDFESKFSPKLISKIIEISLISTSEESKLVMQPQIQLRSKNYGKKMLDLLEILIIKTERKLKKSLEKENNLKPEKTYHINNLIKIILSKIEENIVNEEAIHSIKKLANQFEEEQYQMIEQMRMYKKYVRESGIIFLEFEQSGVLRFISGNRDSQILNFVKNVWESGKPIFNLIFGDNKKLSSQLKRTLRGSLKSEKIFEIDRNVKARICLQERKIDKIHILLEDGDESCDSQREDTLIIGKSCQKKIKNSGNSSNSINTIQEIENKNPGITKEGWLDLFLNKNSDSMKSLKSKKKKYQGASSRFIDREKENMTRKFSLESSERTVCRITEFDLLNPNFNVIDLDYGELEEFVFDILSELDYFSLLIKEKKRIHNFIGDLHDHYEIHSNPFHNFQHGVNVMHMCFLLSKMPSNFSILNEKDIFAIVFSGLCHDVGHTGFTNAFEIASRSKKAITYNDRSPLENYHASLTFELLRKEENNFVSGLSKEDFSKFRQAVIENILFTDIKEHFPLLKKFNDLIGSGKVFGRDESSIVSNIIVHASDFGGSVKNFELCKEWSFRVNTEFANQYRVEGELGLAQTPFMKDLSNPAVLSKAEGGFLKVIVYPLYQSLDKLYLTEGLVHRFKKNIEQNIIEWEQIHKKEAQRRLDDESIQG